MKSLTTLTLAVLAGAATAQSRSAFVDLEAINGISLVQNGLMMTLTVDSNANIVFGGQTYTVNSVFGAYLLSNDDDLTGSAGTTAGWDFWNNNGGVGGVIGYRTQPPNGVIVPPGGTRIFSFSALGGSVEQVGYHIRVNEAAPFWGGDNTGFATVPEPASLVALGGFALAALLRRRTK